MEPDGIAFENSWVLVYPDESLVAIDKPSGGYPYKAWHLGQVHVWGSKEEAEGYENIMKEGFRPMKAFLGLRRV